MDHQKRSPVLVLTKKLLLLIKKGFPNFSALRKTLSEKSATSVYGMNEELVLKLEKMPAEENPVCSSKKSKKRKFSISIYRHLLRL